MSLFQTLFRKAVVLHEMGRVDESLQVFLQCLTVDEDFPGAKRQMERVREIFLESFWLQAEGVSQSTAGQRRRLNIYTSTLQHGSLHESSLSSQEEALALPTSQH